MSKQISTKWMGMPTTTIMTTSTKKKFLLQNKHFFFFISVFAYFLEFIRFCSCVLLVIVAVEKSEWVSEWKRKIGIKCQANRLNFLMRMLYIHWMCTFEQVKNNIFVFLIISSIAFKSVKSYSLTHRYRIILRGDNEIKKKKKISSYSFGLLHI